ncbi:MAG: branched-chain amino acid transport system ATP-binding protein [Chloroflexota bacterium]|nr:branched-chain amino acid transport system ATP-binding protein [Chloroflexota bacterium]
MAPLLEIDSIEVFYGRVQALRGVSLSVEEGEVVTLIGSNGAGKTTTLRTISGLIRPAAGTVRLNGEVISGLKAPTIVARGVGHSPEGRHVFSRMTVRVNLELGAYLRKDKEIRKTMDRVFDLFPRLKERENQLAGTLSGGEQQMLAMGRAMMTRPKVLLLDEPSLGLSPVLVETIFQVIGELHNEGTTILLIEQNALLALRTASRGYVMETGVVVKADSAEALLASDDVKRAYLGI